MRFDTARALEWTGAFGFPRAAGSDGERRAGEIAGDELARLGLRVERRAIEGKRMPDPAQAWLGWFGVGLWSVALEVATHQGGAWPVRLGLALGALLWLRLTTVEGFVLGGPWLRRCATTNILAGREVEGTPPSVRVVFHTPLDSFEPGRELVPRWVATPVVAALLGAQVFFGLTIHRNPLRLPHGNLAGLCCAVLLWLAIGMRIFLLVRRRWGPDVDVRDNRTGLALLLELARSWPQGKGTDARIEAWFVATGGRPLAGAGLRALVQAIRHEWPARPTLVVNLLAPGIGSGLTLVEQGTGQLAAKAAADLWIPHQVAHRAAIARDHRPFGRRGPAFVAMVGSGVASGRRSGSGPAPAVEADALGRAAQLATEIALRWARQSPQSGSASSE
jgi:hypothetical protein